MKIKKAILVSGIVFWLIDVVGFS